MSLVDSILVFAILVFACLITPVITSNMVDKKNISTTSKKNVEKDATKMVATKELGSIQAVGQTLHITYRLVNTTTKPISDIRIIDTSFPSTAFRVAKVSAEYLSTDKNGNASKNSSVKENLRIEIPVAHTLQPGDRTLKTIQLVPLTAGAQMDQPADVYYWSEKKRYVLQSTSRGLFTIYASVDDQAYHTARLTSSIFSSASFFETDGKFAWRNFAIFQEWKQRSVIGVWAALASALPMYWFEKMRDDALGVNKKKEKKKENFKFSKKTSGTSTPKVLKGEWWWWWFIWLTLFIDW